MHPGIHNSKRVESTHSPIDLTKPNSTTNRKTHPKTNAIPSRGIESGILTDTDSGREFAAHANALDVLGAVCGVTASPFHRACQAVRRTGKGKHRQCLHCIIYKPKKKKKNMHTLRR